MNDDELGPGVRRMLHRLDGMTPAMPAFDDLSPQPTGGGRHRTAALLIGALVVVTAGIGTLLLRSADDTTVRSSQTAPMSSATGPEVDDRRPGAGPSDSVTDSTEPATTTTAAPSTSPPTVAATTTSPPSSAPPPTSTALDPSRAPCVAPYRGNEQYPLRRCDVGFGVARVHTELIAQGYLPYEPPDVPVFTVEIEDAVRAFQRDHGLEVDGLVGPLTWMELTAAYQAQMPDPNGDGRLDPWELIIIGDANEPCDTAGPAVCTGG